MALINSFLDNEMFEIYLRNNTNISDSTLMNYKGIIKRFVSEYDDLKEPNNYMDFLVRHSVRGRNYAAKSALLHFTKYKIDDPTTLKRLKDNINILDIKQKPSKKYNDIEPLTDDQVIDVINNLQEPKHKVISYIMLLTGMRIGDVLNIPVGGIYPEEIDGYTVLVIKTEQKGGQPITRHIWNQDIQKEILGYIMLVNTGTGFYFIDKNKCYDKRSNPATKLYSWKHYNYIRHWRDLKDALISCHIDRQRFAAHCHRRAFAKKVWFKYKDMDKLQRMMGHKNVETSMLYLRSEGWDTTDVSRELQLGSSAVK